MLLFAEVNQIKTGIETKHFFQNISFNHIPVYGESIVTNIVYNVHNGSRRQCTCFLKEFRGIPVL